MQICLMIEGQEGVTWRQWAELATRCEELGFDGLFRSDHALSLFEPDGRGSLDAWATIAAVAATTERIRLGTLVSPIGFRHPAHLARVVATTDHVSGGRVEVGIGAGWYAREHTEFGFDFPDDPSRVARYEEYVEVVHRLLSEEGPIDHEGRHYRLRRARLAPRPVQRPHPPIVMGGMAGPRAAAIAARWADEYNLYDTAPDEVAAKRHRLHRACLDAGRPPTQLRISINGNVLVGADGDDLLARAARHGAYEASDASPAVHLAGLGDRRLVGTPAAIVGRIERYAAAGVSRVMMQVFPHDDDAAITMIGEEVVPAARAMTTTEPEGDGIDGE